MADRSINRLPDEFCNICPKCSHFETCRAPCYPVSMYLKRDNLAVYERSHTDETGKTVTILFAKSREIPESALPQEFADTGIPADKVQRTFNTDNESPFAGFNPQLKQTGIFIDRFFHRSSYSDLAVKYDVTEHDAIKIYHAAGKRLRQVIDAMDGPRGIRNLDHWKKQVEERSGIIPKGQKWYLLNKLFGLRPSEIAEMEGLDKKSSCIRQLIIRVSDQLKAGEVSLIETTPEEAEAAKARLDNQRKKRRERRAKKKQFQ